MGLLAVNKMTTSETILSVERTLCKIDCASKKRLLEKLAALISENSDDLNSDYLFEQLLSRERLGSTGIGSGIAIPHCRCKALDRTLGALITLESPIDFDAIDNQPVDVVFAMLVPENAENTHLQTLASLAESLQKPAFVASLRQAADRGELFQAALQSGI